MWRGLKRCSPYLEFTMNQCIHIFSTLNFVSNGPNKEIYITHTWFCSTYSGRIHCVILGFSHMEKTDSIYIRKQERGTMRYINKYPTQVFWAFSN